MSEQHILNWAATAVTPTYSNSETQTLIQRCLNGDETAFVALYNRHATMIYRLAYSLLQHQEDAEEVLQDSFEYAFRQLKQYNPQKSAFKTWLYRITVSRCRNKRRRKWLPTFSLEKLVHQDIGDPEETKLDDLLMLDDRQKQVWAALQQLSPKLREVTVLRYYQNLRYKEIGAILDIPDKTAESRMRLAHKALQKLLVDIIDEDDVVRKA